VPRSYKSDTTGGRAIGNITPHTPFTQAQRDFNAASISSPGAGEFTKDYNSPFSLLGSLTVALNRVGS
jgi:hypothetical protein